MPVTVSAAANGDRVKITERHAARTALEEAMTMTAQHIVMVWKKEKDPAVLQNTGFPMKKQSKPKNTNRATKTPTPGKVTVKQTAESGTVEITVGRVEGATHYQVQRCLGVPTSESTWDDLDSFVHCRHNIVKGQEPGQKYSFRVRCFGVGGYSDWTAPVTLIVI